VPKGHPRPERMRQWLSDAPAVNEWAQRILAKLEETGTEHPINIELDGDLASPSPEEPSLIADVSDVVRLIDQYSAVRSLQSELLAKARNDTDERRAVFALAPYALCIGIGIGFASLLCKPLNI